MVGSDFFDYETVAASQTDQVLGVTGGHGDLLHALVITVATAATSTVSLKDGAGSAVPIVAANTPIGVYRAEFNTRSANGAWSITTGAGATVVAIGDFAAG
jgi:hypothetical protein